MPMVRAVGAGLVGLMMLLGIVPTGAAVTGQEPSVRVYRGETSLGQRMRIVTFTDDTGTWIETIHLGRGVTLACEDGTETEGWWFDRGLEREEVPVSDGRFAYDNVSYQQATHVHGQIRAHGGSGTLSDAQASLVDVERAQLCASGELTWVVDRVAEGERLAAGAGRNTVASPVRAGARASDLRNYRGRTSQGTRMWVTIGTAEPNPFLAFSFQRTLGCQDGTELRWEWGEVLLGWTMSDARLDVDLASPRDRLFVSGRLSTHGGAGTLIETAPALTADEQDVQLCTTGALGWRLWRIDEGF